MKNLIFIFVSALLIGILAPATASASTGECVSNFEWNYVHRHHMAKVGVHREFDFSGHKTFYFVETAGSESEDYPVILRMVRKYRACGGGSYKVSYSRVMYPDGTHEHWYPNWSSIFD